MPGDGSNILFSAVVKQIRKEIACAPIRRAFSGFQFAMLQQHLLLFHHGLNLVSSEGVSSRNVVEAKGSTKDLGRGVVLWLRFRKPVLK